MRKKRSNNKLFLIVDLAFFRLKLGELITPVLAFFAMTKRKTSKIISDKLYWKILLLSSFVLVLLFNSFSWFYNEYVGPGVLFSVGRVEHQIEQYDQDGEFIEVVEGVSTVIYEPNMGVTTKGTKFLEVTNNGTLDMDFRITFQLDGTTTDAGVMYYRVYDVTEEVETAIIDGENDTKLKAYAAANPIDPNIENDNVIPISNMSTINRFTRNGSIRVEDVQDSNPKYYRIDYGMYEGADSSVYNDRSISVHTEVYSTQYGRIQDEEESGQVWLVLNEKDFRDALNASLPGDIIRIMDDVVVEGNINVNRRLHLNANNNTLTITGDLIYDFVDFGSLTINTTGSGRIEVDGDFIINTPKNEVTLLGSNEQYDIYVGGELRVNGLEEDDLDGILFELVRVVSDKESNEPKDVRIMSNTRVNVGPEVDLGILSSSNGAANIEIVNSGNIVQIDLANMTLLPTFTKSQIYIYNLGTIYGLVDQATILLPSTATPYLGPNNGNTTIIKGLTSSDITVSGSENFTQSDIIYDTVEDAVSPIEGLDNAYRVTIREPDRHLETILNSYFVSVGSPDAQESINDIEHLELVTINAQYVVNQDFDFMRSSSMSNLEYLDLDRARVRDGSNLNVIKAGALDGKTSLKTVILPRTLNVIGANAFRGITLGAIPADQGEQFEFLRIPSGVNSIGANAFDEARHVYFQGISKPTFEGAVFNNTAASGTRIFVFESLITSFQNDANIQQANVHRRGELSDNRQYFVFDYEDGVGISLYRGPSSLGSNIGVPNEITVNSYPMTTRVVCASAYRHVTISESGASLSLPNSLRHIASYAFYGLKINTANLSNIETIGKSAFANNNLGELILSNVTDVGAEAFINTPATIIHFENIEIIRERAFANAPNVYELKLANVGEIREEAFLNTPSVARVYFENDDTMFFNNQEMIDILVGPNALFSNWGQYIDGRLRVYVPEGNSPNGTLILDLYKQLFSENEHYIYKTGNLVGSYTHFSVPFNLYEYTVREVTLQNHEQQNITGWEIVSYQGSDLADAYNIPSVLTYDGTTHPVISIGPDAFRNVAVVEDNAPSISSLNLIVLGTNAFRNLSINEFVGPNVVDVGEYAFYESTVREAELENLNRARRFSFANTDYLWSLNLGNVKTINDRALENTNALQRLYLLNESMDVDFHLNFISGSISTNPRFRIYVPIDDEQVEYYRSIIAYPNLVFANGYTVGSFVHQGVDIGEYTVREVTLENKDEVNVTGWELIEYHGARIDSVYEIPISFNVDGTTHPVISFGRDAFSHATFESGVGFDLVNNNIIRVRYNAFANLTPLKGVESNNLISVEESAFENSGIMYGRFDNLQRVEKLAFANMASLYSLNLGTVTFMEENAIHNANYLQQIIFDAWTTDVSFHINSINNIGSLTNERLRIYVTDDTDPLGTPYIEIYRELFNQEYRPYFYPRGYIVGSYTPPGTPYNIGEFSVREVTINDYSGTPVTGWELIEYHGATLSSLYEFPNIVTANGQTYPIVSIGERAYFHTNSTVNADFDIISDDLITIGRRAFYNVSGVGVVSANYVTNIGEEAFRYNTLKEARFERLNVTGSYALANNSNLQVVDLGVINTISEGLLMNNNNVAQIFINNTNAGTTDMNINIGDNAFTNVGTSLGNRLRVYVPEGVAHGSTTYIELYQNTFPEIFAQYMYQRGHIVGSYVHSAIDYDIGEFAIREVTKYQVTGWEIVDYHGANISEGFEIPFEFTVGEVTMPVISIGERAFYFTVVSGDYTWNLDLPQFVIEIDDYAFYETGMNTIEGLNLERIGVSAFEGADLISINFTGIKLIDEYAFHMNDNMAVAYVGSGVEEIKNYAFYHTNSAMNNFHISTEIPPPIYANTFRAPPLEIHVPFDSFHPYRNAPIWGDYNISRSQAAYQGTFLFNVINGDEIEITGVQGNNNTLTIPDTFDIDGVDYEVTAIAKGAFDVTGQLRTLNLPQYLRRISDGFMGTNTRVLNINAHNQSEFFSSINGVLFDIDEEVLIMYPNNRGGDTYTLPTSTRAINARAFSHATNLRTINFNSDLVVISHESFYNCSLLNTFNFNSPTPPFITGVEAFPVRTDLTINVPAGSVDTYRNRFTLYRYRNYIQ